MGYHCTRSKPDNNMMSLILQRQGICSKKAEEVKREETRKTSVGMQGGGGEPADSL